MSHLDRMIGAEKKSKLFTQEHEEQNAKAPAKIIFSPILMNKKQSICSFGYAFKKSHSLLSLTLQLPAMGLQSLWLLNCEMRTMVFLTIPQV